jgi:hypothetical protein
MFEQQQRRTNSITSFVRRKSSMTNTIMQLDEEEHEYHGGLTLTPFSPSTPNSATSTFMRFGSSSSVYGSNNNVSPNSTTPVMTKSEPIYVKKMKSNVNSQLYAAQKIPPPSDTPSPSCEESTTSPVGKSKIKSLISKLKSKRPSLRVKTN